ncbi:MAG: Ig-like domain-containing protein [Rubrivivax sp.]|nr:Ig-like domain-containing protein [Rubrivivax sp.]
MRILWVSLCSLVLVACGGGGGNAGTSTFGSGSGGGTGGGGGGTPTPVAADLIIDATSLQLTNSASSSTTLTVTAVDAARVVVAGAVVQLSADNDGVVAQSSTTTDADGKVNATLTIGGNRANRIITVTATSSAVAKTVAVQVIGTRITSTLVPAIVPPGGVGEVQYRVIDQTGNAMVGQAVSVSAPGLTPSATAAGAVTGTNGDYKFTYTAPATAGSYPIATSIGGVTDTQTLSVQGSASVGPVTANINSASVSANPSVVGVNAAGAPVNSRSEIRALFLTAGNVPVKNVRVRFDLAGDANSIGGTFSTGSNTLYSDDNGIVSTAYIPGTRSSPTNGVTVRACYGTTDTDPNLIGCVTSAVVQLTLVSEPLGVSIGTNETIVVGDLTYTKRFLVSVADSAGNAKADVALSVSLDLPQYRKGFYAVVGDSWVKQGGDVAVCLNEDSNRNGVLEAGEDINGNARLDPGRSDVTVRLLRSTTGADGTAIVEITYAKSFGSWADAWITVAASGVSGTEGRATYVLAPIPVDAAAIKNVNSPPAFVRSPYGTFGSCSSPN